MFFVVCCRGLSAAVRFLAVLLASAVLTSLAPLPAIAVSGESPQATQASPRPQDGARPGERVPVSRDRYSATYAGSKPGEYVTETYTGPIHYRDGETWLPIDASLRADPNGRFGNGGRNEFGLSVAASNDDPQLARIDSKRGQALGFGLEGARPGVASPDPQSGFEDIVYRGALPHVDVRLSSLADGIKEVLVLQSAQAPSRFVFPLSLTGLRAELDNQGQVLYRDDKGEVAFLTPRPWMEDSANEPDGPPTTSYDAAYKLVEMQGGGQALELTISREWLDDPSRVFPVKVDPTAYYNYLPHFERDTYYFKANTTNASTTNTALRAGAFNADHYRAFLMFNANYLGNTQGQGGASPGEGTHTINSATLSVYQTAASNCAQSVFAKRVTQTWYTSPDSLAGQFGPTYEAASGSQTPSGTCIAPPGWINLDVTTMAGEWDKFRGSSTQGRANHGIALLGSLNATDSYRAYRSQDYSGTTYDPVLKVNWTNNIPGTPSTGMSPAPGARLTSSIDTLKIDTYDADLAESRLSQFQLRRRDSSGNYVAYASGQSSPFQCNCTSSWRVGSLPTGAYEWQARTWDGFDYSGWSSPYRFTIDAPPLAPSVSSSTHPDPNAWYTSTSASLSWTEPDSASGITGYNWLHDTAATTLPPTTEPVMTTGRSAGVTAPQGVSYFHVRARNNAGQWGSAGHYTLQVDSGRPTTPAVSSSTHPDQNACYANPTPSMSWTASSSVSGIAGYSWAPDSQPGTTPDNSVETTGLTASTPPLPDGTSYFHVKALNRAGTGGDAGHYRLRIDSTKPALSSVTSSTHPDQNRAYPDTTVSMAWAASDTCGIAGYSYVLDQTAGTVPDTNGEGAATSGTFTAPQVVKGKDNYFHVRALNGSGLWSDPVHYRLRIYDVAPPEPLSPAEAAVVPATTPTLEIGPVTAPAGSTMSYQFLVSTSTSFTTPLLDSGYQTGTTYLVPTGKLEPGKTYYWQARAKESGGGEGSFFSPPRSFTVNSPPPQTTAIKPDDGATVYSLTPDLVVNAVVDPQKQNVAYRFEVSSTADFVAGTVVADSGWQAGTTFTVPADKLSDAQKYYWRVATQDSMGAGLGPWSLARSFTTMKLAVPEVTKTISAAEGSSGQALSPAAADGSTPAAHAAGEAATYTVTVRNPNPVDITVEKVTDTLPSQFVPSGRVKVGDVDCLPTVCTLVGPILTVPVPKSTIPAGGSVTFVYTGVLTGGERDCLSGVVNSAVASSSQLGDSKPATASTTVCGAGLGVESWWSYIGASTGPQSEALVNAANGNLVVSATDSTPVQGRGRLGYVLRRTYNSQETTVATLPGSLGAGWLLNVGFSGDLAGAGVTPTGLIVPRVGQAAQALTEPLSVTLADRDGTRHTFTPRKNLPVLDVTDVLADDPLRPLALVPPAGYSLCVTTAYDAPAGVHLGLWRYVAVKPTDSTTPACSQIAATAQHPTDPSVVVGYAAVRPDRLRTEFAATGQLLSMIDGSGSELRYAYYGNDERTGVVTGPLRYVYEPRSTDGAGNSCQLGRDTLGVPSLAATCRAFTLSYNGQDVPEPWLTTSQPADSTEVRDPAGRVTRYLFQRTPLAAGVQGPAMLLTAVVNPPQTAGGTSDQIGYHYQGHKRPDGTSVDCGGSGYQLCEVVDARNNVTKVTYTRPSNDPVSSLAGLGRVASLTDRRGTPTVFTYRDRQSTVTVRGSQQRRAFLDLDEFGRAGRVVDRDETDLNTILHQSFLTWDSDAAPCAVTPGRANHLCAQVRERNLSDPNVTDQRTDWTYDDNGMVLRTRATSGATAASGTPAVLDTTFGYATQYWSTDRSDTNNPYGVTERTRKVAGVGEHTAVTEGPPATTLFAVADRIEQLSPRGNAAGAAFAEHRTDYTVDRTTSRRPNLAPDGEVCAAAAFNTGLVCAVTAQVKPETAEGAPVPSVTRYTYDTFGQRLTMRTPNAGATGAAYRYSYAPGTRRDLSGTVSADGWLVGVTDPEGAFVAFAHDAAGNVVRTWDRNATAGRTLSEFPGEPGNEIANPTNSRYAETLYGPGTPAQAFARPWRWALSERTPVGEVTARCIDAHGNLRLERPARGSKLQPLTDCASSGPVLPALGEFDVVYDDSATGGQAAADDRPVSVLQPEQRAAGQPATKADYDAFGNLTSVTDSRGVPTRTVYDKVNRPVQVTTVRASTDTELPAGADADCPAGLDGASVCVTKVEYDMVDNPVRTIDPDGKISTATYNAVSWKTETLVDGSGPGQSRDALTTPGDPVTLRTVVQYDADGNPTSVCPPREFGAAPGAAGPTGVCTVEGKYSRHLTYDPTGRMLSETAWRLDDNTPEPDDYRRITTTYRYDLSGNQRSTTDPNGHITTTVHDALDRAVELVRPRQGTTTFSTTMSYDPVGNRTSVTEQLDSAGATRTDAFSYDPNNRLVDSLTGAVGATALADGLSTGEQNVRTRRIYDADGRVVGQYGPRAFAANVSDPDERFLTWTDVDRNGRPIATFTPRHDAGTGTAGAGDSQASECPTGAQPAVRVAGVPDYPAEVGACVSRMGYDAADRMTVMTLPTAGGALPGATPRQLTVGYTADGLRTKITGPSPEGAGTVDTTIGHDGSGRPVRTVMPAAPGSPDRSMTMAYTADGLLAVQTARGADGTLRTTKFGYNLNGTQNRVVDPLGQSSITQYTADELPESSVDTGGHTTRYQYDNAGNITRLFDASAGAKDATNPEGVPTVFTYTADNLVATELRPTRGDGNRLEIAWDYDGAGRKTSQRMRTVTGAAPGQPGENDPALRALVADGGRHSFSYSPADRLTTQTGRNNESITTGYDPDGNPVRISDSTLDEAGRSSELTSSFYLDGLLRSTGDGTNTTRYGYDGAGQVSVREHGPDGVSTSGDKLERTVFGYNDAGARIRTDNSAATPKDPSTGQAKPWTASYDPAGRMSRELAPNGQLTTHGYNPDDSLAVKTTVVDESAGAALVAKWAYTYDALGRQLTQDHTGQAVNGAEADSDHRYEYDAGGRVTVFADGPGASRVHTAAFDANGNRTSYTTPGVGTQTSTYSPDNTQRSSTDLDNTNERFSSYTAFGALEADGCYRYGYDGFDRLTSTGGDPNVSRCATAPTTRYAYDGLDRQRSRFEASTTDLTEPASITGLHYDGLGTAVASETVTVGTTASNKAFALSPTGQPLSLTNRSNDLLATPSTAYLTDDGTGTITTITGDQPTSAGATADTFTTCTARFDPWGTTTASSTTENGTPGQRTVNPCGSTATGEAGDSGNDRFYRGERRDQATGNYQLGSRTYDPSRTGFLTPDSHRDRHPIADLALGTDPLTTNRYNYVNGDPLNYLDPTGHEPRPHHDKNYKDPDPNRNESYEYEKGNQAAAQKAYTRRTEKQRDAAAARRSGSTTAPPFALASSQSPASESFTWRGSGDLHDAVQDELFRRTCPNDYAEKNDPFGIDIPFFRDLGCDIEVPIDDGSKRRADLLHFEGGYLYEIKPDHPSGRAAGRAQVAEYLAALDPERSDTGSWTTGPAFAEFSIDYYGHDIKVRYTGDGVVGYRPACDNRPNGGSNNCRNVDLNNPKGKLNTLRKWHDGFKGLGEDLESRLPLPPILRRLPVLVR